MLGDRTLAAWLVLATFAALYTCTPTGSARGDATSTVGAVAVGHAPFRGILTAELDRMGIGLAEAPDAQYTIHGKVLRMERRRLDGGVQVECEVVLRLGDATGQRIVQQLEGTAGARGPGEVRALEQVALRAAIRGALRSLPGA